MPKIGSLSSHTQLERRYLSRYRCADCGSRLDSGACQAATPCDREARAWKRRACLEGMREKARPMEGGLSLQTHKIVGLR